MAHERVHLVAAKNAGLLLGTSEQLTGTLAYRFINFLLVYIIFYFVEVAEHRAGVGETHLRLGLFSHSVPISIQERGRLLLWT